MGWLIKVHDMHTVPNFVVIGLNLLRCDDLTFSKWQNDAVYEKYMQVLIFGNSDLKMPIHTLEMGVLGDMTPK